MLSPIVLRNRRIRTKFRCCGCCCGCDEDVVADVVDVVVAATDVVVVMVGMLVCSAELLANKGAV